LRADRDGRHLARNQAVARRPLRAMPKDFATCINMMQCRAAPSRRPQELLDAACWIHSTLFAPAALAHSVHSGGRHPRGRSGGLNEEDRGYRKAVQTR